MDKLSQFYIELSTDAEKMRQFNLSAANRQKMLDEAQIENSQEILCLNQKQLQEHMANNLSQQSGQWHNMKNQIGNTTNSDNQVSYLGRGSRA